jgi:hypothetical protein
MRNPIGTRGAGEYARWVKFSRTDRLSPEEREIVDRFERGVIDAAEAGRLLIASVRTVDAAEPAETDTPDETEREAHPDETPEEAAARALVERIARDVYADPAS